VVAEAGVVVVLGLVFGTVLGGAVAWTLVAVLTGVFDPPPSAPAVPWGYLGLLAAGVLGGVAIACTVVLRSIRRSGTTVLRET
jgi:putative ABC transport system permease protein